MKILFAAENASTEQMALSGMPFLRATSVHLWRIIADKLDLPLLENRHEVLTNDDDRHGTAYTITVDVAQGTTTGISASRQVDDL